MTRVAVAGGPFDIIVADPPWRGDFSASDSRSPDRHYPTMATEDICAVEVPAAAAALLFLWCTAPMLEHGLAVVAAWGFSYRTSAVWCKPTMGAGQWFRSQHELVLLGHRGGFPRPPWGTQSRSVLHAPRGRHSVKPEVLQDEIMRVFPGRRYLELFGRRQRPGWTVWGDEVGGEDRRGDPSARRRVS